MRSHHRCDFLVGQLLDALDVAGVANDTVVALIGDHGWQVCTVGCAKGRPSPL